MVRVCVTICARRSHTYESAVLYVCISVVYRMCQRRESYVSALRIVCVSTANRMCHNPYS
ncbi:hypothetical protein [Prevotella sp.]|uniref:hypothetical protein n=1 Tax=Prevotella sp. TaxID=59823 RepID=UPI001CAE3BC6|nr:hypothetical protein [Prevotella sp.]MBF1628222.1 hypothetical protein [Prevotella sp.]